jgi:hypothetical protein
VLTLLSNSKHPAANLCRRLFAFHFIHEAVLSIPPVWSAYLLEGCEPNPTQPVVPTVIFAAG